MELNEAFGRMVNFYASACRYEYQGRIGQIATAIFILLLSCSPRSEEPQQHAFSTDEEGRFYLADSGNLRIAVYGPDGRYLHSDCVLRIRNWFRFPRRPGNLRCHCGYVNPRTAGVI